MANVITNDELRTKSILGFLERTIEYLKQTPPDKVGWNDLLRELEFMFGDGSENKPLGCISNADYDNG